MEASSTLTIRDFKEVIEFSLDHGLRRTIMGLGAPGIGKSQMVKQITEARGMGFVDVRLLLYSETDLKGIPYPDKEDGTTSWFPNKLLPKAGRDKEKGILLIDELTSAPKRVQAAAYQLIQDYKLGEYEVPEGWFIVACGNREDDDGIYVQMPSPLANRMEIHMLQADLEQWKADFAYPRGVNPSVIAYLNFSPRSLHTQEPGKVSMKFASPRSWEAVSDILNASGSSLDNISRIKIRGNIGDVQAAAFFEFLKLEGQLVDAEKILQGKEKAVPTDRSLLFLTLSSLVSKLQAVSAVRALSGDLATRVENALRYMLTCPPEFMVVGMKDLVSLQPKVMRNFIVGEFDDPVMMDFISRHDYLFK